MPESRPRIVFFDMEGTLLGKEYRLDDGIVAPSAWTLLAERLGPGCLAAEQQTKLHWKAGKYSNYIEWMRATVEIHRQFGLTESLFRSVTDSVAFTPNVQAAVERIRSWGSKTVVISGGFKALSDRVQRALRIDHAFAACEYFFDEESGQIDHFNLLPADEVGKVDFMRLMCREYGVQSTDCAFVGDGMNDVHLAREVGFSVAFNAQPELVAASTASIAQLAGAEDFIAVANLLEQHFLTRESPEGRFDGVRAGHTSQSEHST